MFKIQMSSCKLNVVFNFIKTRTNTVTELLGIQNRLHFNNAMRRKALTPKSEKN